MMRQPAPARIQRRRQRGVAVITALLLTTLAVTIVASLFWQQQVQVRSMENQRLQLQTRWILRGALDWARLILRQDGIDGADYTALTGVWATPLAETRLDQYVERERVEGENFNATLSGQLTDAQSRYNLTNLANNRIVVPEELEVFRRLLSNLQLDPALAQTVADEVARTQPAAPVSQQQQQQPQQPQPQQVAAGSAGQPMALMRVEDLLALSGVTAQTVERLRDYVIVLPDRAPVNVNTAAAELLAALFTNYSVSEATSLVNTRKRVPFRDKAGFLNAVGGNRQVAQGVDYDVKSSNFLVLSRVRLDRANLDAQALIRRESRANNFRTTVSWIRQN